MTDINTQALVEEIESANLAYRSGTPIMDDSAYDALVETLRSVDPAHPLLDRVEAEKMETLGATRRHASPMLSTLKGYTASDVENWLNRLLKAAETLGVANPMLRITPKLDGMAAHWDGSVLVTRGDGAFGQVITHAWDRGLTADTPHLGAGEIVLKEDFFLNDIQPNFDMAHPRNFVVGFIGADTIKSHHRQAIAAKAVRFVPYAGLEAQEIPAEELRDQWQNLLDAPMAVGYRTDGVIVEAVDPGIKEYLGATGSHHRWMLALKKMGETATTTVRSVTWQVGRTGRITPVMEVEPVTLSGATISRCTAHTARHTLRMGLGENSSILIVRSGEVIPKLVHVFEKSDRPATVDACPSCGGEVEWDNDYLICPNTSLCPAQKAAAMQHFFARMGVNGFGPKVCEQIVEHTDPAVTPLDVMNFGEPRLVSCGISAGVAVNLVKAIASRKADVILDTDAVASFGVRHLGRGDARKILAQHPFHEWEALKAEDLERISGFGTHTATQIAPHLSRVAAGLQELIRLGFRIEDTKKAATTRDSAIAGKKMVFTGSMSRSRKDMENEARAMGAEVGSSVSKNTDLLVVGEKAGSKLTKAQQLGVSVMTEAEYGEFLAAS